MMMMMMPRAGPLGGRAPLAAQPSWAGGRGPSILSRAELADVGAHARRSPSATNSCSSMPDTDGDALGAAAQRMTSLVQPVSLYTVGALPPRAARLTEFTVGALPPRAARLSANTVGALPEHAPHAAAYRHAPHAAAYRGGLLHAHRRPRCTCSSCTCTRA